MPGGSARALVAALGTLATLFTAVPARAAADAGGFPDVPTDHWAAEAIAFVTHPDREWLPAREEGFGPGDLLTRRDVARAMVRAFPPPPDFASDRTFDDVQADDPLIDGFRWAAKRHFLPVKDRNIRPDATVSRRILDPAIVRALGLTAYANGIARLQTKDGKRVVSGWSTGSIMVTQRLELYPNMDPEAAEIRPSEPMTRAHAAIALRRMANWIGRDLAYDAWRLTGYAAPPPLPAMNETRLRAARWAMRFVAYPYIWAGEWHRETPESYPFGAQPQGGFDCSGYAWWVMQQTSKSWNVAKYRGYDGWSLGGRTATDIARKATKKIPFEKTQAMDLAFFELNNDPSRFEHMGVLLGNGWMIHSSGARSGVTLERVDEGYWREHFGYARRIIPADAP